jgi:hypothetical protein
MQSIWQYLEIRSLYLEHKITGGISMWPSQIQELFDRVISKTAQFDYPPDLFNNEAH